jgi:lipopolysaccharide assembly protein A
MKRIFYLVVIVVTLLFGITFAIHNYGQNVDLKYYFGLHWQGPVSIALLTVLAIGVAIGYLAGLRMVIRMQRQLVQARKDIRQIEQEVMNLRALPIKDVI